MLCFNFDKKQLVPLKGDPTQVNRPANTGRIIFNADGIDYTSTEKDGLAVAIEVE